MALAGLVRFVSYMGEKHRPAKFMADSASRTTLWPMPGSAASKFGGERWDSQKTHLETIISLGKGGMVLPSPVSRFVPWAGERK